MSFEKFAELTKEQYPDFDFTGFEIEEAMIVIDGYEENYDLACTGNYDDYAVDDNFIEFRYQLPKGYIGVIFSKEDKKVFFMIDVRGTH